MPQYLEIQPFVSWAGSSTGLLWNLPETASPMMQPSPKEGKAQPQLTPRSISSALVRPPAEAPRTWKRGA